MKPRKLIGWLLIVAAIGLMLFGDFGVVTKMSMIAVNLAAMALLAVGVVLVGA